jgi:RES domain-containing protein
LEEGKHAPGRPPGRSIRVTAYRWCVADRDPHAKGGVAQFEARYHRAGETRPWYGALCECGMWAEFHRAFKSDMDPTEIVVWAAEASIEAHVLDLTDPAVQAALSITETELIADDYTVCQGIAMLAREWGFQGLLVPSAAERGGLNVVVFGEHAPGGVVIDTVVQRRGQRHTGHQQGR